MILSITIILLALLILACYKWKYLIPLVFVAFYIVAIQIPDYFGLPLEAKYLKGKEAIVLSSFKNYLMVLLEGEETPRLVKMKEPNKDIEMSLEVEKVTVILFGEGEGVPGYSNSGSDEFTIIDLEDSEQFGKD